MKLTIEISEEDKTLIERLLSRFKEDGHELQTIEALAEMLLQDVAISERRPGSWEGANMITVLRAHGYDVF